MSDELPSGYYNASFVSEAFFGRPEISLDYDVNKLQPYYFKPDGSGTYMYQVYPVITKISAQMGGVAGGTVLTISGSGFTADLVGNSVEVGNVYTPYMTGRLCRMCHPPAESLCLDVLTVLP